MSIENNTTGYESNDDIVNSVLNDAFGSTDQPQSDNNAQTSAQPPAQGEDQTATDPQHVANNQQQASSGTATYAQPQVQPNAYGQNPQAQVNPGRVKDDGQGNLVDEQGTLVARRGVERRWYSEAQNASRQAQQTRQELEGLRTQLDAYEKAYGTFQNLQMPPQDVAIGATLYKSFQTNPRATIEYLLTEARKNGVQLDGLGGTVDTQAIKAILAEQLAPITAERERVVKERAADQAAEKEYTDFVNNPRFEYARIHENELATLITQEPETTLAEAYLTLQVAASQAGLDFSKPLGPQWLAKKNGQQNVQPRTAAPVNQTGNMPRAPLPTGRPVGNVSMVTNSRVAAASSNNSDIVKEALREAGLSI